MTIRAFAAHLGVSARTVSYWEAGGSMVVPSSASQETLDAALRLASAEVRDRFARLVAPGRDSEGSAVRAEAGEADPIEFEWLGADEQQPGPALTDRPSGDEPLPWGHNSQDRTGHLVDQLRQHQGLPYLPPEHVTDGLGTFLNSPDRALLVTGPPGVGKTSLALHLAHRHHDDAIFQLHNGGSWSTDTDLAREILRYDSRSGGDDALLALEALLVAADRATIIIIDGLDTPERLDTAARQCDALIRHIYDDRLRFILCFRTPPEPDLAHFPLLQSSLHHPNAHPGIALGRWDERTASRIWSEDAAADQPTWNLLPQALRRMARTPLLMRMIKSQLPQSHRQGGNTYAFIEQWLGTRRTDEPALIEHDILDDFEQARRHLTDIRATRDPGRAVHVLNSLAATSQADARTRETLALTVAGLAHHDPELLSSAALAPGCDPDTLGLILEAASEHDLRLNREVIRTAATQALHAPHPGLATAVLRYRQAEVSDAERAQWIAEVLTRYGSDLWAAINEHFVETTGSLASALLSRLELHNAQHAIYLARYLSSLLLLDAATRTALQSHPDWRVRAALAEATASQQPPDPATVAALTHDPDYKVRARLAEVIPRLHGIEPAPILETLLADPNWHVRTTALQTIVRESEAETEQLAATALDHCQSPEWQRCPPAAAAALRELAALTRSAMLPSNMESGSQLMVTDRGENSRDGIPGSHKSQQTHQARHQSSDTRQSAPRALLNGAQIGRTEYRRMRGRRALQIALDLYDLNQAMEVAAEVAKAGTDFIEVGDPLIKTSGVAAIEAIKGCAPDTLIVAEMMSADWGRNQIDLAAEAGADVVLLIGPASTASMQQATSASNKHDIPVTLDIPAAHRNQDWIRRAEQAGIDGLTITTNIDLGIAGPTPMGQLEQVRPHTQRPIAVSGGFSLSDPEIILNSDWDILIVGRAIVDAVDPAQATRQLLDLIDHPGSRKE